MGVKCIKQSDCCSSETNLSHQTNNTQEPLFQNEDKNEKIEDLEKTKRSSNFGVNDFANKFLKLEKKLTKRTNSKNSYSFSSPLTSTSKFNNELEQLIIINEQNSKLENDDIEMINNVFSNNSFLKSLNDKNKEDIMKEIRLAKIQSNKIIIKEGFKGRFLYIIKKGLVELIKDNVSKKKLTKGESFGEYALLNDSLRTYTIKSISECELWILDRISFRKIIDASSLENFKENKKFINSISFFHALENYQISLLCSALYKEMYVANQIIAKEGEEANCIYIIKEGEVNCVKEGRIIRTLSKGENFGERSIFLDSTRSLDVIAKTDCICYLITFDVLKNILGFSYSEVLLIQIIKMSFLKSKYFKNIHINLIDKIAKLFQMKNYKKDDVIYKKGTCMCEIFSIVIDGNLIDSKREIVGKRGEIIYDKNLFLQDNDALNSDLTADPDCLICELEVKEIFKILEVENFQQLANKSTELKILSNSQLLRKFHFDKIEELLSKMNRKIYKENEIIVSKGKEGKNILFVKSGEVRIENINQDISHNILGTFGCKELGPSSSIGDNLLFSNTYNDTIIASNDCEILYINISMFEKTLGENLITYLKNSLILRDKNLNLRDFYFYGDFNNHFNPIVSLVKSKLNNQFYVIKCYPKDLIINENSFNQIEDLKKINIRIDYPFIQNYIKTFQDRNFLYFVFEYIQGMELSDLINEKEQLSFSTYQLQFYFSNLLLIINYLHSKNIIHRSIQPDNIIINSNGYLNLISLATAKIIEDRTNSILGNIFYKAPEVISGEGYSFESDYWSVGVLMYEIAIGKLPFNGNEDDPMSVYFSIINSKLTFPNDFNDISFISLLSNMLEKSPYNRYSKIELIQGHSWFKNFNFKDVEFLIINPLFIPKIQPINYENNESFIKHSILMFKEWQKESGIVVEEKDRKEYEFWFETF